MNQFAADDATDFLTFANTRIMAASTEVRQYLRERRSQRWVRHGQVHLDRNERDKALEYSQRALSIDRDFGPAYHLLARALMPGDDYLAVLGRIHNDWNPSTYVEIGVESGRSMTLANPGTRAIGIDPRPVLSHPIRARAKLFPMTSDAFFRVYDLRQEIDAPSFRLGFIDGLHQFDQVLRDFINLERHADEKTVIAIHDCYPITSLSANRNRQTTFWSGDVWKMVPCLRALRPELEVHTVPAAPTGLCLVTRLDPTSSVLDRKFDEILAAYETLDYSCVQTDPSRMLNLIPNEWPHIASLLPR